MLSKPWLSIIIPTWNRGDWTVEAVQSILEASWPMEIEIIVVIDGSTDDTAQRLPTLPQLRILSQAHAGPGAARNYGIRQALGIYVAFLDSDNRWGPQTPQILYQAMQFGSQLIIGTSWRWMPPEQPWKTSYIFRFSNFPSLAHGLSETSSLGTGSLIIKRELFLDIGGFPEHHDNAEDLELVLHLLSYSATVVHSPPLFAEREHPDRRSYRADATLRGMMRLFTRWSESPATQLLVAKAFRATSRELAAHGHLRQALALYRYGWKMQWKERRWRYLIGMPIAGTIGSVFQR